MMSTPLRAFIDYLHGDGLVVLPEVELLLFAVGILIFDFFLEKKEKHFSAYLALVGVVASGFGVYLQIRRYNGDRLASAAFPGLVGFHDAILIDGFFIVFAILFLAAAALVILLSVHGKDLEIEEEGEFYSLILVACIGMMLMASGIDLVIIFLGMELMAVSFYLLCGFLRSNRRSTEAALKAFVLGAFGSAILAYGFSLLYGLSASTNVVQIGDMLERRLRFTFAHGFVDWLFVLAFVTVVAGLLFKIAAAPFHQWAPDVYEGSPTPVAAYVFFGSQIAGFAVLLRLLFYLFGGSHPTWQFLIAGISVASVAWGNLAALTQNNLQRLFAYTAIAHVGYLLLGLVAWDPSMQSNTAATGIFFYLITYGFAMLGIFAVIIIVRQRGSMSATVDDLDGLYQRNPTIAVSLTIFLLSVVGIPPSAGFMGKYLIFEALIETRHPGLAVFAALSLIFSAYCYIRVLTHAWMRVPGAAPAPQFSDAQAVALGVTLFVTLAAGLYPEPFTRLARYAFGQ